MNDDIRLQLKETIIEAMGSFKKEHSDLMYNVIKEIRDSREETNGIMSEHKLDDQKNFNDLKIELATLKEQTAPIRSAWTQVVKYGIALTLGALGIKLFK